MSGTEINKVIEYLLYGWLIIVLLICAVTDLRQRRIPNKLTYPMVIAALLINSFIGGWDGFLFSLGGLAFGFAVFFLPYSLGGMGAGDVKLMSAVGAVLGFKQTAVCFLFIAICGGIMALGYMVCRRSFKATISKVFLSFLYLVTLRDASLLKVDKRKIIQEGIPYGIAITSGVFLFFAYLLVNNKTSSAFPVF
jgi:prepilin peptidase CpaA